ncbi:glutamate synthase [Caldivirga sp.]|uniref:GltB/FmdC/FwdC-like GXGXG domain-containing protein n=1 Tax=Caldivirga sp. TaxID=2080243 RepID=UPI0025BAA42E|nr:glutamate synthase [Caldivirga sp.]
MVIINHYPSSCGILGIIRAGNAPSIRGSDVVEAISTVKYRGVGLGAGYAAVRINGHGKYRVGLFAVNEYYNDVENLITEHLGISGAKVTNIRVKGKVGKVIDAEYELEGVDGNVDDLINIINDRLWELGGIGRVYYWGRHITVFKGIGHPDEVAKVYGVNNYEADAWIAHTRFPTNSPGHLPYWSHPFALNDTAIVHNGELSSYGVNAVHLGTTMGVRGLVGTDSEAVAYIFNYLVKVIGLDIETAVKVLVNPSLRGITDPWLIRLLNEYRWARLDGPFTIIMLMHHADDVYLIALADRFKLRPVVVGYDGQYYYAASEEAEIRAISPNARVWTLAPGGYLIVSLKRGVVSWGRPKEQLDVFFPTRSFPRQSDGDAINAKGLDYREINEEILRRIMNGSRLVKVINVNGQRFIGVNLPRYKLKDVRVEIYGTPGNALANLNNGVEFVVYGNAQDDVADTMHDGKVIIHGDARDVLGQTLQGGKIFVRGNAGNRVGVQMREYSSKRPYLIIGGRVDDYLGEYMAGGVIMVLGIDAYRAGKEAELTGNYVGSGMVGGRIYVRGKVDYSKVGLAPSKHEIRVLTEALREEGYPEDTLNEWLNRVLQVSHVPRPMADYRELTEDEVRELKPVLMDYARELKIDENLIDDLIGEKYTIIKPGIKGILTQGYKGFE